MTEALLDIEEPTLDYPGPRVTPELVDANISSIYYFTAAQGVLGQLLDNGEEEEHVLQALESEPALTLLTFCVIVLHNGFTVTGQSACAAPENFDEQVGRDIALRDAKAKIWPLLGYELRSQLSACEVP